MYKAIRLLKEAPHVFCFAIMATCLIAGYCNLRSSIESKNYVETIGEVCNLEEREVMRHQRYETRYDYDVVWYVDGEEYVEHLDGQTDYPGEGEITLWVSPDGKDFRFSTSEEIGKDVPLDFLVAVISGILGLILSIYKYSQMDKSRTHMIEVWESTKTYGIMCAFFSLVGAAIVVAVAVSDYKKTGVLDMKDYDILILIIVLCFIGSLIAYFIGRHNLKKLGE